MLMTILEIQDQLGRKLSFEEIPIRIVSLVPSITHLLYSFGLDKEVVGITRFCKFPLPWRKQKKIIGGTKNFKKESIEALNPDLILASKEENPKELTLALNEIAPVYVSDVFNLKSNAQLIKDLGSILQRQQIARQIISEINLKKETLLKSKSRQPLRAVYMIWRDPWMSIGGDTFIHQMMQLAAFDNMLKDRLRYPVLSLKDLQQMSPEVILLSSEPYPFKEKHREELQKVLPHTRILLVKGEPFTWFGSYPIQAIDYFNQLI